MPFTSDWTKDDNVTCPECETTGYVESRLYEHEAMDFEDQTPSEMVKYRCDCCTHEWWGPNPGEGPAVPD